MDFKEQLAVLNNLLDTGYIKNLLEQKLPAFYPEFASILEIKIKPYKKHVGVSSAVYVLEYECLYQDQRNNQRRLNIFVSAHTDGSRQAAFVNNQFLYQHGFDHGTYLTPRPLFYSPELLAFFYQGVNGRKLKKLVKDEPQMDLRPIITLTAGWLKQLHNLSVAGTDFMVKDFGIKDMRPRPEKFLLDFSRYNPTQGQAMQNLFNKLLALEADLATQTNKTLVHGDYHPENIIVSNLEPDRIKVIDFTDLAWGDPCLDLGGFCQQFDFMFQEILSRPVINSYKTFFVEAYFGEAFADIDPEYIKRVNFYQAWTTLRTSTFLLYMKDREHDLVEVINECYKYLELIEKNQASINLYT